MNPAKTTLVCFAVKAEAKYFRQRAQARPDIAVLLTGMGRRNAERALRAALSSQRPGRVITAGFAGGLTPDLATGTVVFSADAATVLEPVLLAAGAHAVCFHCSDQVVTTAVQKRALQANTGAQVVEMESQWIRMLCEQQNIPAATVRVVLDTASEDLALDFNELMTADQQIDGRKLAAVLVRSPRKIPALLRLQKQSAVAARRLGEVLGQVLQL